MTRRRLLIALTLLLLVGGLALVPGVRWPVYGWLRGEAFYQGRPTSYWRRQVEQFDAEMPYHQNAGRPPPSWLDQALAWCGVAAGGDNRAVLSRDPEAVPVLVELLHDPNPGVIWLAAEQLSPTGSEREVVVPALVRALGTPYTALRLLVVISLGRYGPDAIAKGNRYLEEIDGDVRITPEGAPRWVVREPAPEPKAASERPVQQQ